MQRKLKRQAQASPDHADPRPFCACGLSRTFPYCDSSQLISRSREPGKLVSCGSGEAAELSQTQVRAVET
jgi:hypothetical protein